MKIPQNCLCIAKSRLGNQTLWQFTGARVGYRMDIVLVDNEDGTFQNIKNHYFDLPRVIRRETCELMFEYPEAKFAMESSYG